MQIPKPILDQIEWDNRADEPEHYRVKSLKPCSNPCPDCGKTVTDRRIIFKQHDRPYTHWRTKCWNCKRVRNPETGAFDIEDAAAFAFYRKLQKNH